MSTPLKFLTGLEKDLYRLDKIQGQVIFAINEDGSLANIYYDYSTEKRINVSKSDGFGGEIPQYVKEINISNFSVSSLTGEGDKNEFLIAFTGTYAEYEEALSKNLIQEGMIVHITDDEDVAVEPTIAVDKLPAANANHRGRILLLEQNNTDTPYMCLKKSGAYAWYEIKTGTNGIQGEGDLPEIEGGETPPVEDGSTTAKLGVAVLGTMILGQE